MALGFNNPGVDWNNAGALLANRAGDRIGAGLASMGQSIADGIRQYQEKKEQKKMEEAADAYLTDYAKRRGLDLPPDAIKAGRKSVGAENVIRMFEYMKASEDQQKMAVYQEQEAQAEQQRIAESMRLFDKSAKDGDSANGISQALMHYAESGGRDVQGIAGVLAKASDASISAAKDKRAAEGDRVGNELTKAQTEEVRARMEREAKGEGDVPLGEAKDIQGLPGMKAVRTGKGSVQIVEANPGAMKDDEKLRAALPIFNKQLEQYIKDTRNEDGTVKTEGFWARFPGGKKPSDPVDLNPFFESILSQLGYPGAQPQQQPGATPPAPVPTAMPQQQPAQVGIDPYAGIQ